MKMTTVKFFLCFSNKTSFYNIDLKFNLFKKKLLRTAKNINNCLKTCYEK